MFTPTMFPWDKKWSSTKKSLGQICINSFDERMLSHDRWLWFFFGRLRVPTRRCDLVVPADWGWGRSNKDGELGECWLYRSGGAIASS